MTALRWWSRPYDLRQAFLVGVLLPLAGLSATVVLGLVNWAERSLEARLQGEIELISRAVAPGISRSLGTDRDRHMQQSLETLFSIRRVYGAAVYDDQGDLVVSAGIADPDLRGSRAASAVVRTGEEDGRYRSVDGRNVYAYFTPLIDHGGRIHGLLQITRDRREIDASVRELRAVAWSVWLAAVGSSLLVTLILYRRLVGRRVRELLARMGALAAGDRRVSFQAAAPREFAEISHGFNAMVASIRHAEGELRERQTRERDLERQLQEAERVAVVGRVAQGLAHELGSPLSVIVGRIRRLERAIPASDAASRRALDDVRRQAARMTDIVRQLLNYGRRQAGRRVDVPLRALLERLRDAADTECVGADPDRVVVDTERVVVDDVPDDAVLRSDPVRLELALSNLIRNAVRHAADQVQVRVERQPGWLTVAVCDDGPGVAAADRQHIFQPFFTRQAPGEGTGLGLAIVDSVMREHGGSVTYRTAAGGGACFELRFPVTPSGDAEGESA
jgi:two-component system, NtrC family, sensor kinase